MYIVTNKSQKMFFISISILGRSGVKQKRATVQLKLKRAVLSCIHIIESLLSVLIYPK